MQEKTSQASTEQKSSIVLDDEVEKIISNITLKRPKASYIQYVSSAMEEYKKENPGKKIELGQFSKKCSETWKTEPEELKKKFQQKYLEDKEKYKKDLEFVKQIGRASCRERV